jgi:hypothetical protein
MAQVAAGATHTCFVAQSSEVFCAGDESGGAAFAMPAAGPSSIIGVFDGNQYNGGG